MRDPGLRSHRRTELQVGILMILAFLGLVAGIFWISGARFGGNEITLFVKAESAGSIAEGATVSLRGVPVGTVQQIRLVQDGVVLRLEASPKGDLPTDTKAAIGSAGFLGQAGVALRPGSAATSLVSGDTIFAESAPGLTDLAGELGGQAADVLNRTQRMLSDSVIASVQVGAEGFAGTMTELDSMLERQSATLEQLIENLESATASLDQAADGPELERTVQNLDSLTARLAAASEQFDSTSKSLDSILRKIDDGQGSMGKLVNDPALHDQMVATMENLQSASEEVALMMKSFREDPEKYTKGLKISLF
ncbi:MAG: MlaD family protein [Gemmatimonadales bacterium]|jgi:phospholipid/cholesterol/gamma-HCH transport system substrate-binding protein